MGKSPYNNVSSCLFVSGVLLILGDEDGSGRAHWTVGKIDHTMIHFPRIPSL